ncbi:AMP-binding protein [Streptomyces phaeochromogenes]
MSGAEQHFSDVLGRLAELPAPEQVRVLTDLVCAETEAALRAIRRESATPVDAERSFQEQGLDSLGLVTLQRGVNDATGLTLPPTIGFDHPTPAALAVFLRAELLGEPGEGDGAPVGSADQAAGHPSARDDSDPVVIVGTGCHFPGGIDSADDLWQLVADGREVLGDFPTDRDWDIERLLNGAPEWLPPETGVVRLGTDAVTVERKPRVGPRRRQEISDTDTAYMIFTSGTTGRPKGVVMSHRGVTSFYRGMLAYSIVGREDRVATTSPLQFDFSLLDIGLALGSGAAVVPVPRDVLRFPRHFLHLLKDAEVTQVNGVPSIWRSVLRHEGEQLAALDRIRGVLFCGEVFPMPELRHLQQLLPAARIVNCYGATESMACSFTDVPRPIPESLEALSIGFAHPGAEMTLVDQAGRPVDESGVVGEIHLRSPALFTGYWGDPEATRAALVPDPLEPRSGQAVFRTGDLARRGDDGELYFCGRADSQVQIRGNRVELGEVERRLLDFPAVTAAAAVVVPGADAAQEGTLSAFVVVESGAAPFDLRELRDFCRLALPAYMIPKAIRTVDRLPVTPNGKTDKAALTKLLVAVG